MSGAGIGAGAGAELEAGAGTVEGRDSGRDVAVAAAGAAHPPLKLSDYHCVGFDMDHALIRYRVDATSKLIYAGFVSFLTSEKGYPPETFAEFDPSFGFKGLLFCFTSGDFLQLGVDGKVLRVWHGTRRLDSMAMKRLYGDAKWDRFDVLQRAEKHETFYFFSTYFDIPAAFVLAQLVDYTDAKRAEAGDCTEGETTSYASIRPDVWEAFPAMYSFDSCSANVGGFFPHIRKDTAKYVHPRRDLAEKLRKLRKDSDTRVFLATNSHKEFTSLLMEYAFGDDWTDLFDLVIVNARKPSFFATAQAFRHLDTAGTRDGEPISSLKWRSGDVFCRGHHQAVELLSRAEAHHDGHHLEVALHEHGHITGARCSACDAALRSGAAGGTEAATVGGGAGEAGAAGAAGADAGADDESVGLDLSSLRTPGSTTSACRPTAAAAEETPPRDRFLYVGDHIHGDIWAASKLAGWDTVAVVEELEAHTHHSRTHRRGNSTPFYVAEAGSDEDKHAPEPRPSHLTNLLSTHCVGLVSDAEHLFDGLLPTAAASGATSAPLGSEAFYTPTIHHPPDMRAE